MNTRILSLVLALGLSMGTVVAQKIGHIAMDQLVQLMPETQAAQTEICLLYTSPSPRDGLLSRMPSSA